MSSTLIEPAPEVNDVSAAILGAAIEVHRHLGPGLPESAYERALCFELDARGVLYASQPTFEITYKDRVVGTCRPDLVVENLVVVELKSVDTLAAIHRAQLISYLRQTRLSLGLLINFNVYSLRDGIRRVVVSKQH